tara:strand:+ start:4123 stop:4653 length:531 start_codon:yes stop_codon:yes gene_type:complete
MSEDAKKPEVPVADSQGSSTGAEANLSDAESSLTYENKKYRQRAQEAEAKIAELEKKFTSIEEAKLKEKEDFKALYEKVSSENELLTSTAKKWEKYELNRRSSLLESVPEEERERLGKLDLDTLEFVTNKISNVKTNPPEVAGNPRGNPKVKDFTKMSDSEKRENWDDIVNSFRNN